MKNKHHLMSESVVICVVLCMVTLFWFDSNIEHPKEKKC